MYSAQNEEKSVVSERCIRNWKDEIHKCMTSMSKRVYIDKLDDLVIKYNNTYQSTIKMKHVNVNARLYIDFGKTDKDPEVNMLTLENIKV